MTEKPLLKVLLLNPPGKRVYIRDYYCSKVSKSNYLFHPIDLLMLSGVLSREHEVHVIDAIAERLSPDRCRERIAKLSPQVVVSLVGAVSLEEDLPFLAGLYVEGRRILVTGDASRENPAEWLAHHPFIDAVVTDFTSQGVLDYLAGRPVAEGVVPKGAHNPPSGKASREFSLVPRHELFTSQNYRFPFVRHKSFGTVLSDYGCPFPCTFCIMATLGYRFRPVEDVLAELRKLKAMGRREIFFMDQTFGVNRQRTLELCRGMVSEKLGFGWVCFSRVDVVDRELLEAMKSAGCHTIIFGVESASEEILTKYRKGYNKEQIRGAFRMARAAGIQTVATFIMGLPEETEETAAETLALLQEIDCDFASFNVAVPRMGTALRQDALAAGLIGEEMAVMDQTGSTVAMATKQLTRERIQELRSQVVRDFYLRPGYLWRRLMGIRSFYQLREQFYEGMVLLRDVIWKNE